MIWHHRRVGVVVAGFVLAASACAGGSGSGHADGAASPLDSALEPTPEPLPGPGLPDSEGETAVQAAFEAYRDALVAGDGERAVALLAPSSVDHVAGLQELARTAGPDEIEVRPVADRLLIAGLRVLVPASVLDTAPTGELLEVAVEHGLVGGAVGLTTVHGIAVAGDEAIVHARGGGGPFEVPMRRRGDEWQVDLVGVLDVVGSELEELAVRLGVGEDDLILALLADTTGRPLGPEVFAAPRS